MSVKLDVLVFGAHPDDAEIGMAGSICKWVSNGRKVGICDLTLAELSSNGTVERRQAEAGKASSLLGLSARVNLKLPDRGLQRVPMQTDLLVEQIRAYQPEVVLAPYWEDRHPDHMMCSHMVDEAVFNAKLRRYRLEWPAWTVARQFYYFINHTVKPDILIDVTQVYSRKMEVLKAYQSQFMPPEQGEDRVATPLNQGYLEQVESRDHTMGQIHTVRYAEGFVSRLPLLLENL